MNIDKEKFERKLCTCCSIEAVKKLLFDCEVEPVDCNECTLTHYCNTCVNNKRFKDNFKQKPKEWYEKPESFPCLCWISNVDKNPSDYISVIDGHYKENRGLGAFSLTPGGFVKYATPLTKKEVLNYCVGEK